ncbi:MAG TPA: hypothetical protein VL978_10875 [Puia sp.]|nr:hypothetical protein [Puia sp.]
MSIEISGKVTRTTRKPWLFVEENKRPGNRHLQGSLNQFKLFIKKPRILPMDITENLSKRFPTFLTDNATPVFAGATSRIFDGTKSTAIH